MRKFAAILIVAACNQRAAGPRLEWASDEAAAFARAKAEHKGVIAEAYAEWTSACVELDHELHDRALAPRASAWIAYRRDVSKGTDDDARWQDAHGAGTLPFVGFYDADGHELARLDRLVPSDELARFIAGVRAR